MRDKKEIFNDATKAENDLRGMGGVLDNEPVKTIRAQGKT